LDYEKTVLRDIYMGIYKYVELSVLTLQVHKELLLIARENKNLQ